MYLSAFERHQILRFVTALDDLRTAGVAADEAFEMLKFVRTVGFCQKDVVRTADIFYRFTQNAARQNMTVAKAEQYIESLLQQKQPKTPKANVGAFLNNLSQSLARIQLSGIPAVSERRETDSQIVLTITIPK